MKISSDIKNFCVANSTHLSKTFDCLCRDLLIARLNAFGVDRNAIKFIYDFLSDRSEKTKVTFSFSAYLGIIYGVCTAGVYTWVSAVQHRSVQFIF